jgi:DNA-binding PadR family transcriptional regulator
MSRNKYDQRTSFRSWDPTADGPAGGNVGNYRRRHHDPMGDAEHGNPDDYGRRGTRGHRGGSRGRGIGRAGRGQLRAAVLLLLAERPRHGYDLIAELTDRSDGAWSPSPGAIYPMLRRLSAKGLVEPNESEDGRRSFDLTTEGRAYVDEHRAEWGEPWQDAAGDGRRQGRRLSEAGRSLAAAVSQVAKVGTDEQATKAEEILDRTRKEIYALLAE